jgi:AcrR family transcriptional regulator
MANTAEKRGRGRPSQGAREAVLEAARELFMERDYAQVSTEEILERAGVSRGALYHHFESKRDLYRAVWRDSEARLIDGLAAAAATAGTPYEALAIGCRTYLDQAVSNREMRRIGLLQSRTVLGWEEWRQGIADLGLATMAATVQAAIDAGELRPTDVESTAHLMLAALIEAALLIVTADDPSAARRDAELPLMRMLEGLRR